MSSQAAPPMNPDSSEASVRELELARLQGDAYGAALAHMIMSVARDGDEQTAGYYRVAYALEEAEGMYEVQEGRLVWCEPGEANLHVEIAVRDAADGRFVPGLRVMATLIGPDDRPVGTHEHPLLWHPMIYHYGRNWSVPFDGDYRLRVRVEPPTFMRHDEINGLRFFEPVEVEFTGVRVERGGD